MRATKFHNILENNKRRNLCTEEWLELVNLYASDAPEELAKIICIFEKKLEFSNDTLFDDKFMYIYKLNGIMYFGEDMEEFPVDEKFRWPWIVHNLPVPFMTKDAWNLIFRFISINDMFELSCVNKFLNEYITKADKAWFYHKKQLNECVVYSKEFCLDYKFFKWLKDCFYMKKMPVGIMKLILNLNLPFEDIFILNDYSLPLSIPENSESYVLKTMTGYAGFERGFKKKNFRYILNGYTSSESKKMPRDVFKWIIHHLLDSVDFKKTLLETSLFRKWDVFKLLQTHPFDNPK